MSDEFTSPPPQEQAAPVATSAPQEASAKAQLYDISGKEPILGNIAHDEVTDAVASGRYSFPKGSPINVISPDGTHGTIDPHEAPEAFQNGYKYATPKDIEHAKYAEQPIAAGLEGLAQGVAGPLATLAETKLGIAGPKDIRGRAEANPWSHGIGETAGFVGSLATGVGEGALVEQAGKALSKGIEGAGLLSDAARGATKMGAEMALLQSGDEVSKMITQDPEQSMSTAITDIGLASALGGLMGGAASGIVSPLWKATVGDKAGQLVADLQGRMKYHIENPDLQSSIQSELGDHYSFIKGMADDVYGPTGLKAQEIQKLVPDMSPKITDQVQGLSDELGSSLKKMTSKPNSYPERLTSKLQEDLNAYQDRVSNPSATSHDVFEATQDLKQTLQGYAKYDKFVKPVDEAYDFVRDAKNMAFKLRNALEDNKVWGQAAERQQSINKAFTQFKPALEDFESKFTSEIANPEGGYKRVIDPGKVATLINQTDKPAGQLKRTMLDNFLKASDKYKDVIAKTHSNLGLETPLNPTSMHATQGIMGKLTPGASIADYFVNKGMKEAGANALGSGIGGAIGHITGIPGAGLIGTLLGQNTLGPVFKSVLPALIKPLMEAKVNPEAFKAAVDYGMSVVKGQELISKATQNVFKIGKQALPDSAIPTEKERMKLDKLLKVAQSDPKALLDGPGAPQSHYLPTHGTTLGQTAQTAVNYLNAQRPVADRAAPLDPKPVVNSTAKAAFNRTLDIAQQPLMVLDHIKKGTLLPSDVMTVKTLYPQLYTKISQQLTNSMINHMSKEGMVPYKTRMGLSLFTGQPLDSTMKPDSIVSAQPKPTEQNQPQPGQATQAKHSTSSLNKIAPSYMTKSQSREVDRSKNS